MVRVKQRRGSTKKKNKKRGRNHNYSKNKEDSTVVNSKQLGSRGGGGGRLNTIIDVVKEELKPALSKEEEEEKWERKKKDCYHKAMKKTKSLKEGYLYCSYGTACDYGYDHVELGNIYRVCWGCHNYVCEECEKEDEKRRKRVPMTKGKVSGDKLPIVVACSGGCDNNLCRECFGEAMYCDVCGAFSCCNDKCSPGYTAWSKNKNAPFPECLSCKRDQEYE